MWDLKSILLTEIELFEIVRWEIRYFGNVSEFYK